MEAENSSKGQNEANEDKNAMDENNDARGRPMETTEEVKMRPTRTKMPRTRKMMPGRGHWRPKAQEKV
jgi:hypothetical protein